MDFRTGASTAINGDTICENARSACCAINRERSKGIRKALKPDYRDGENSDDVSFREKCQLNLVPIVKLAGSLLISHLFYMATTRPFLLMGAFEKGFSLKMEFCC
jgi:hypothetical protein